MNPAIIIGIVILFGGVIGVFLYLRAKKRREAERREAERKVAIAEAEKEKAEFLRKQKAASDAEEMEKKIKAMKAESDAKLARLAREVQRREGERQLERKVGRARRIETPDAEKRRMYRADRERARGVAKVGHQEGPRNPAVFMATVAMVLGISGAAVRKLSDRAKMGDRGAQMRLRNAGRKAKSIIRSDPRGAHRRAKQHAKRMMIHRRRGSKFGRRITSAVGKMQHRGPPRRMTGKTNRGGMRRGRFGRTGKFSKGPASLRRGRELGKTHRGGPKRFGPTRRSLKRASKIGKTKRKDEKAKKKQPGKIGKAAGAVIAAANKVFWGKKKWGF